MIGIQVPYRLLALRRSRSTVVPARIECLLCYALVVLFLCNWLAELAAEVP